MLHVVDIDVATDVMHNLINSNSIDHPFATIAAVSPINKGGGKCVLNLAKYLERTVRERVVGKHLGCPTFTRRYYNFSSMALFTLLDRYSKITIGSREPINDLVKCFDAMAQKFCITVPQSYADELKVPDHYLTREFFTQCSPRSRALLGFVQKLAEPEKLSAHYFEYMKALQSKNLDSAQYQQEFDEFSQYINFFSKRQTKADIRDFFEERMKAGQGVSAFQKHVNALFSPYARMLAEVMQQILLPNVILASGLPDSELYARAGHCYQDSTDAGYRLRNFACDFTEYDSSQYALSPYANSLFMLLFGAEPLLVDLYINMRRTWVLSDDMMKLYGKHKMHSGEPFTLIGNTLFGILVIAHCIRFDHLGYAMFKGDDSGIAATNVSFDPEAIQWCVSRGLQLKDEFPPVMEFAGSIVIPLGGFPDVIRKTAKFLSTIFTDKKHYDQFVVNIDADLQCVTSYEHFLMGCEYTAAYYNYCNRTNRLRADDISILYAFLYHHKQQPFSKLHDFDAEPLHIYEQLTNFSPAPR